MAERMGITKIRVSQTERGEVSTVDVISHYVQAIGEQLQISAVFGNDLLIFRALWHQWRTAPRRGRFSELFALQRNNE